MAGVLNAWLESKCPLRGLPTTRGMEALAAYTAIVGFLGLVLPGKQVHGTFLADGTRLSYKCNGLLVTVSTAALLAASWRTGFLSLEAIGDLGGELFASTFAVSVVLSLWLFFVGYTSSSTSSSLKPRYIGSHELRECMTCWSLSGRRDASPGPTFHASLARGGW